MIHAFIHLEGIRDDGSHGTEFQRLMHFINSATFPDFQVRSILGRVPFAGCVTQRPQAGYNITVYHNFHEECDYYRQHWWTCVKCGNVVKRAINRKPQKADCISRMSGSRNTACYDPRCKWHQHLNLCGGNYTKVGPSATALILSSHCLQTREPPKKELKRRAQSSPLLYPKRPKNPKQCKYTLGRRISHGSL